MKFFAIRIQPDVRENQADRYTEFPTLDEYKHIWNSGQKRQDGFHECVNFKNFNGKIEGYIPPNRVSIPANEKIAFIFLTNKANKKESKKYNLFDTIIGIQVGCHLTSQPCPRKDVPTELQKYLKKNASPLEYHYTTSYKNSILLENPIENASELIFPKSIYKSTWSMYPGSVREINNDSILFEVLSRIDYSISRRSPLYQKWKRIKNSFHLNLLRTFSEIEDIEYEEVANILHKNKLSDFDFSSSIKKYPIPKKRSILSYNRDPNIVAGALLRAKGVCQGCFQEAPFERSSDGSLYLEVHHIKPLSEGGADSFDNVCALCPNCHKLLHLGEKNERYKEIMKNIKEMLVKYKIGT